MSFELVLAKESFKFSGTHFTILGPTEGERLHGHNYYVQVRLKVKALDPKLGLAFDFNAIKPVVREICESLDEHILLPMSSPYLKVFHENGQVRVEFAAKKYEFPKEDVIELPLPNITSEELAQFLAQRISKRTEHLPFQALTVQVEETRGQGVAYTLERPK